jgi:hypothetical protein
MDMDYDMWLIACSSNLKTHSNFEFQSSIRRASRERVCVRERAHNEALVHTVLSQNIEFGFLEGIVRGHKGDLLKTQDYANLLQCDSIDGEW